ncbi:unnamed protein product [Caenorhabditis brenneri]
MPATLDIVRVGTFLKKADKTAVVGVQPNRLNEDPNLFGDLRNGLDLTCDGFRDEGYGDLFYSFFDYIKKTSNKGASLKKVINADFISNRRNLITIASSAFEGRAKKEIRALRKNGVIFLCDRASENDTPHIDGTGYKFEQYMTLNADGQPHHPNEPVSNAECVRSVIRTTVRNGGEEIKVFYAAEVDAVDKNGSFGEIKTTMSDHEKWIRNKSMDHYLQAYLGMVSFIVKGRREGNIVRQVSRIETSTIPAMEIRWDPQGCKDRLFQVLHKVRSELRNDNEALIISIDGKTVRYSREAVASGWCPLLNDNADRGASCPQDVT